MILHSLQSSNPWLINRLLILQYNTYSRLSLPADFIVGPLVLTNENTHVMYYKHGGAHQWDRDSWRENKRFLVSQLFLRLLEQLKKSDVGSWGHCKPPKGSSGAFKTTTKYKWIWRWSPQLFFQNRIDFSQLSQALAVYFQAWIYMCKYIFFRCWTHRWKNFMRECPDLFKCNNKRCLPSNK